MPPDGSWMRDFPQQFQGRRKIEILVYAFEKQLLELGQVFEDLDQNTDIETASGQNLDYIGTIIPLSRKEAGILSGIKNKAVLPDSDYRQLLKCRALTNTNECTYYDLMAGLNLLYNPKSVSYKEDPQTPATITLDIELSDYINTGNLMNFPPPHSAGVALIRRVVSYHKCVPLVLCANTGDGLPQSTHTVRADAAGNFCSEILTADQACIYAGGSCCSSGILTVRAISTRESVSITAQICTLCASAGSLPQSVQNIRANPVNPANYMEVHADTVQLSCGAGASVQMIQTTVARTVKASENIAAQICTFCAGAGSVLQSSQIVRAIQLNRQNVPVAEHRMFCGTGFSVRTVQTVTVRRAGQLAGATWEDVSGMTWNELSDNLWGDFETEE